MSDGYLSKDREHLARLQRKRRAGMRRMDYMPSAEALTLIEAKRATVQAGSVAATNSAILDAIVGEWAELTGIHCAEVAKPMTPADATGIYGPFRAGAYDFGGTPEFPPASQARAGAYDCGAGLRIRGASWLAENRPKQANQRVLCGAKRHRDGQPCRAMSEPGKRRCKLHGGCSTGPRTPEGKARALANLKRLS